MQAGKASQSAMGSGLLRAEHVREDPPPWVFEDTLAGQLLDAAEIAELEAPMAAWPPVVRRAFRVSHAVRARLAEDVAAAGLAAGRRDYVLLGAGLDTFAWRHPRASRKLTTSVVPVRPAAIARRAAAVASGRVPVRMSRGGASGTSAGAPPGRLRVVQPPEPVSADCISQDGASPRGEPSPIQTVSVTECASRRADGPDIRPYRSGLWSGALGSLATTGRCLWSHQPEIRTLPELPRVGGDLNARLRRGH